MYTISNYEILDMKLALHVVTVVADYFRGPRAHPTVDDVLSKSGIKRNLRAREVSMWILHHKYACTIDDLADFFGRTEVSTRFYIKKLEEALTLKQRRAAGKLSSPYDERASNRLNTLVDSLIALIAQEYPTETPDV